MPYKPHDFYFQKAKKENYPARSVFKLKEADRKFHLLKKGSVVLDLGAAPGSWSKYSLERVGPKGLVVAVDLLPLKVSAPNLVFLKEDIFSLTPEDLFEASQGRPFQVVLSDMAPKTTGDRTGDHFRSLRLAERAFELALSLLQPDGVFMVKVFEGEGLPEFVARVKEGLGPVKRFRPKSTRSESREIFVVARRKGSSGETGKQQGR